MKPQGKCKKRKAAGDKHKRGDVEADTEMGYSMSWTATGQNSGGTACGGRQNPIITLAVSMCKKKVDGQQNLTTYM